MNKPKPKELHTFILFVMSIYSDSNYSHTSLLSAATMAISDAQVEHSRTFFRKHGFDDARVTRELLIRCSIHAGWHHSQYKPRHTFKHMDEVVRQHSMGLVMDAEMISAVQMSPVQAQAVDAYLALPVDVQRKSQLSDWDKWVEDKTNALFS